MAKFGPISRHDLIDYLRQYPLFLVLRSTTWNFK